jgi:hypothetical protein
LILIGNSLSLIDKLICQNSEFTFAKFIL